MGSQLSEPRHKYHQVLLLLLATMLRQAVSLVALALSAHAQGCCQITYAGYRETCGTIRAGPECSAQGWLDRCESGLFCNELSTCCNDVNVRPGDTCAAYPCSSICATKKGKPGRCHQNHPGFAGI